MASQLASARPGAAIALIARPSATARGHATRRVRMFRLQCLLDDRYVPTSRLIGAQSAGMIMFAVGWWAFALIVFSPLHHSDASSSPLAGAALFGAVMGFLLLAATARAFVRDEALHMISFFVTHRVPLTEVVGVAADNGFAAKLQSGRTIGSMAFGSSVIAMITGNRRGKRAGKRLLALLGPNNDDVTAWRQDTATTRARFEMIGVGLAVAVAMVGYASLGSWN